MFPSVLALREDRPVSGKVFTVLLRASGRDVSCTRSVTADMERWDECLECADFDGCYKLSMAKLALESAVQDR